MFKIRENHVLILSCRCTKYLTNSSLIDARLVIAVFPEDGNSLNRMGQNISFNQILIIHDTPTTIVGILSSQSNQSIHRFMALT